MSNEAPQDGEERELFAFLADALRAEGKLFPLSDEEIDRFCSDYKPDEEARQVFLRATKRLQGECGDRERPRKKRAVLEHSEVEGELLALHRNEGDIPDDVTKRLEEHRRRIKERQKSDADEDELDGGEVGDR